MAGFCLCGCGAEVKNKWVRGHSARVNNPSKDPEVSRKKSEKLKGRKGGPAWNKGLSTQTDERVAAYGRSNSESLQADPDRRAMRSTRLKQQWAKGEIRGPSGDQHGRWKGGVSTLQQRTRSALFQKWSRPIMVRDGFQCQRCHNAKGGDLCVHHDRERFATIMHRIVAGRDVSQLTFEQQGSLVDEIVEHHISNSIHGITLCRYCHDEVHQMDPDID